MIMLYSRYERGTISLHADTIDDVAVAVRHYTIVGHCVCVDGAPGIVQHDVQTLLSFPTGGYRFPTPHEQEAFMAAQRRATTIQEVRHS